MCAYYKHIINFQTIKMKKLNLLKVVLASAVVLVACESESTDLTPNDQVAIETANSESVDSIEESPVESETPVLDRAAILADFRSNLAGNWKISSVDSGTSAPAVGEEYEIGLIGSRSLFSLKTLGSNSRPAFNVASVQGDGTIVISFRSTSTALDLGTGGRSFGRFRGFIVSNFTADEIVLVRAGTVGTATFTLTRI